MSRHSTSILLLLLLTATLISVSCKPDPIPADPIYTLGEISITLREGDKLLLSERFDPYGTADLTVIWFTSNPAVVTVSEHGDITAVAAGTADIFIIGTVSASVGVCHVTVKTSAE